MRLEREGTGRYEGVVKAIIGVESRFGHVMAVRWEGNKVWKSGGDAYMADVARDGEALA